MLSFEASLRPSRSTGKNRNYMKTETKHVKYYNLFLKIYRLR